MVEKLRYSAVTADCGAAALETLKNDHSIGVVITDLIMRDMDGVQFYQNARSIERLTDAGSATLPPFILMTAARPGRNAQPRDVDRISLARKIGFFDVLFKPFGEVELSEVLQRVEAQNAEEASDGDELMRQATHVMRRVVAQNDAETAQKFLAQLNAELKKVDDLASQVRKSPQQKTLAFPEPTCGNVRS
jgi:CheY-like chemotaxis protein